MTDELFERVALGCKEELRTMLASAQNGHDPAPWIMASERPDGSFHLQPGFALPGDVAVVSGSVAVVVATHEMLRAIERDSQNLVLQSMDPMPVFWVTADVHGNVISVKRDSSEAAVSQ